MTSLVKQAAMFSRAAHQAVGQKRKYTDEPYWHHTAQVARTVDAVEGRTPEMVAAAHLHDVLEDTQVTITDLKAFFGEEVTLLVHALSDQFVNPSLGNRAQRKALERDRLAAISPAAQTIKYADLIDNTGSIAKHDPGFASVYLVEKRRLLEVMDKGDALLRDHAWATLVEAEVQVKAFMAEQRANTYKVHINGRHKKIVFSERDAWEVIGQQPMGSLHQVYDADNKVRSEFVPY